MKKIYISKCFKFDVDLQNAIKFPENVDGFEDKCVWKCCASFFQLWEERMWLAINVLKSGLKISDPIKRHDS